MSSPPPGCPSRTFPSSATSFLRRGARPQAQERRCRVAGKAAEGRTEGSLTAESGVQSQAFSEKLKKTLNTLTISIANIEAQIAAALGGTSPRSGKGAVRETRQGGELGNGRAVKPPKKRGKRGATKELILEALKAAGAVGISVKELSAKLGLKNQNVHVWFNTTGKKLAKIEKTGKGTYRLNESGAKAEAPVATEKSAKVKTSRVSNPQISAKKSKMVRENSSANAQR